MYENDVLKKLEEAKKTAPYAIEKERYQMAIDEINRLQNLLDQLVVSNESVKNVDTVS